jgi:hypothetical protein
MRIIFSRKGFDSGPKSGGAASPIINGVPYSLPIPTNDYPSKSTYRDLKLCDVLSKVKAKGNLTADSPCHEDPMFWGDKCAFGQTSGAQKHLENNCVGEDDVFLFFGLFAEPGCKRHHRIFGYLRVEEAFAIDSPAKGEEVWRWLEAEGAPRRHPHTIASSKWQKYNTIYRGPGRKAKIAHIDLRLTKPDEPALGREPASLWAIPTWLRKYELTWHQKCARWRDDGMLQTVSRGQEFVADVGDRPEPREWLHKIIELIETGP